MTIPHRELDVRPILRDGGEPFSAIMQAVAELTPGQGLRLLATFKPIPLFQVLGARGFEPVSREIGGGDWEVVFTPVAEKGPGVEPPGESGQGASDDWRIPAREIDCRDLDPPEPMVKALAGVEGLAAGETLCALLPREPLFLFEELKARGHQWRGGLEPEGHYRIVIRAGSAGGRAAMSDKTQEELAERVRQALRIVIDPELGENVVDLGLIYNVAVVEAGVVQVEMTTTTAGCPAASYLKDAVESAAWIVEGIQRVEVRLTYDPPWTPEMMNVDARAHLGFARKAAGR